MLDALSVVERKHGRWLLKDDFRAKHSLKFWACCRQLGSYPETGLWEVSEDW
jgi:hypothetical protein